MKRSALLALVAAFASSAAFAALSDNYGAARVAALRVSCPEDGSNPCLVEVARVRPLTNAAQADADAAGLDVAGLRERIVQRTATRAQINTFLAATSPIP